MTGTPASIANRPPRTSLISSASADLARIGADGLRSRKVMHRISNGSKLGNITYYVTDDRGTRQPRPGNSPASLNVAAIWKLQCKSIWLPNLEERSRWLINAAVAFTVNCG